MSYNEESSDDLEQALVLAAANADPRNNYSVQMYVENPDSVEESSPLETKNENEDDTSATCVDTSYIEKPKTEAVEARSRGGTSSQVDKPSKRLKNDEGESVEVPTGLHAPVIASHYNALEEKGLQERSRSRILHMRNFHNWVKSMMINEYMNKIKAKRKNNTSIRVMDMCCGKGGDLLKWRKAGISHLVCSDIASVSIDQCKARYEDMIKRNSNSRYNRNGVKNFTIEYVVGDCSQTRLREKFRDPSVKLDLVSCQFAFHYGFESLPQAECMVRNASECLLPGGYFIGTIPDANELIARARRNDSNQFGNDVYTVEFVCDVNKPPLFGAKYNFQLDGVVDCPEFLVYFSVLVKVAKKYGLKLIDKQKFRDYFYKMKDEHEGKQLLTNMKCFECYPPQDGQTLMGDSKINYIHAQDYLENKEKASQIGTLSKSEWEVSSLYLLFAFEKVKNTWNPDGTPCFDI